MIAAIGSWLTPAEWDALALSVKVACWCAVFVAAPGIFCGWLLARRDFPGKTLFDGVIHVPLVLPPVVTGYLLLLLLGPHGPLGSWLEAGFGLRVAFTWLGAVVASAVVSFPLMVRAVRLAMELVDPRLEEAATTLGAGSWRRFRTITLPLALPGVLTGLILTFARSLGEFGATITLAGSMAGETRTLPLAVFTLIEIPGAEGSAMRLVLISVAVSLISLTASEMLAKRLRRRLGGGK